MANTLIYFAEKIGVAFAMQIGWGVRSKQFLDIVKFKRTGQFLYTCFEKKKEVLWHGAVHLSINILVRSITQ